MKFGDIIDGLHKGKKYRREGTTGCISYDYRLMYPVFTDYWGHKSDWHIPACDLFASDWEEVIG